MYAGRAESELRVALRNPVCGPPVCDAQRDGIISFRERKAEAYALLRKDTGRIVICEEGGYLYIWIFSKCIYDFFEPFGSIYHIVVGVKHNVGCAVSHGVVAVARYAELIETVYLDIIATGE